MQLFIRKSSDEKRHQKQLDREQASSASTTVEDLPSKPAGESHERPLFETTKKPVFHVDLLGGWLKP